MKSIITGLAMLMTTCYSHAQLFSENDYQKNNNSLLWEISGKDIKTPSYLFGTFHLMCEEDIRFSDNFFKALQASSAVYFEIDLDDPAATFGALKFMYMKDNAVLADFCDSLQYKKTANFFRDSLHIGMAMVNKMKPAFTASLLYPYLMACKTTAGVEMEIMKKAKAAKKEIFGLETVEMQAAVFDKIPYQQQATALMNMIDSIDAYRSNFSKMLTLYKKQQLEEIGNSFDEEADWQQNKEDLLDNRNKKWINSLQNIIPEKGIFIAIGAGHLPGSNGLIQLLKNQGYTVKPVINR